MPRSDLPSDPLDRHGPGLARSAGLAGAATLASRVLGLVREQVLAALFGAGNEMDAFIVAFRIPNLVRDLFAEGAMSAAFVPTFTRQLTVHGKPAPGASATTSSMRCSSSRWRSSSLGVVFARPLVTLYAGDYASVPGKLELTIQLTRVMLPFLTTGGGRRRGDGHAELAASLFRAGAVAGDVQRRDDRVRGRRSSR